MLMVIKSLDMTETAAYQPCFGHSSESDQPRGDVTGGPLGMRTPGFGAIPSVRLCDLIRSLLTSISAVKASLRRDSGTRASLFK